MGVEDHVGRISEVDAPYWQPGNQWRSRLFMRRNDFAVAPYGVVLSSCHLINATIECLE